MSIRYSSKCAKLVINNVQQLAVASEVLKDLEDKLKIKIITILKKCIDNNDGWWSDDTSKTFFFGLQKWPNDNDVYTIWYGLFCNSEKKSWVSGLAEGKIWLSLGIDIEPEDFDMRLREFYKEYGRKLKSLQLGESLFMPLQFTGLASQWKGEDWNGDELKEYLEKSFKNLQQYTELIDKYLIIPMVRGK